MPGNGALQIIEAAIEKARMLGATAPDLLGVLGLALAHEIRKAAGDNDMTKYRLYGIAVHMISKSTFE